MYFGIYNRLRVHVWEPDCHVVRALRKKLKKRATKRAYREERHKLIRAILKEHHEHQKLVTEFRL